MRVYLPTVILCAIASFFVANQFKAHYKAPALVNSVGMKLIRIPAGQFLMGSHPDETLSSSYEEVQRPVTISRDFYIQQTELTQAQFKPVMGEFAPAPKGRKFCLECPVVDVLFNPSFETELPKSRTKTRFRISDYLEKLNLRENCLLSNKEIWEVYQGRSNKDASGCYRLPTEAEWEYACRAQTKGTHFFPADESIGDYATTLENSINDYAPTKEKKPNPYGLYDMIGNVSEFVMDSPPRHSMLSSEPVTDPYIPANPELKKPDVLTRGGDYRGTKTETRCDARNWIYTSYKNPYYHSSRIGFRLVRNP